jgi:hypothetical protein
MTIPRRPSTVVAATVLSLAVATPALTADRGLATALDRIGGNLLGTSAFDAVTFDPQPDPPAVRVYLSTRQAQPVEVVLVTAPGETNPPDPVRAFFRMTVSAAGPRFEYDPNAGEIIPCVLPEDDLTPIPMAPADAGRTVGALRPGLVNAFGEVGRNLFGAGFDAVLANPPDPVQPPRLRMLVPRTSRLELVLVNPPEPVAVMRMMVGGPEVCLQSHVDAGRAGAVRIEEADLSDIDPPDPVRE